MKYANLTIIGFVAAAILTATAQQPQGGKSPHLEFRVIPLEGALSTQHKVTPFRFFDKFVATVWDPVACGQKPINPKFTIDGNKLYLSYELTPARAGADTCTLVAEFDVLDAPNRDLTVYFAGGPEPYVVAKVRKCPFYKPESDDIWECLVPESE